MYSEKYSLIIKLLNKIKKGRNFTFPPSVKYCKSGKCLYLPTSCLLESPGLSALAQVGLFNMIFVVLFYGSLQNILLKIKLSQLIIVLGLRFPEWAQWSQRTRKYKLHILWLSHITYTGCEDKQVLKRQWIHTKEWKQSVDKWAWQWSSSKFWKLPEWSQRTSKYNSLFIDTLCLDQLHRAVGSASDCRSDRSNPSLAS